jgi:dolichyl-phosphate-mannose--protein O-mannosyl transferase
VFVYYAAVLGLAAVAAGWRRKKWDIGLRWVVGWIVSFVPFFIIPRSMYLYHYLIPLAFGCMAAGAAIDIWLPRAMRGVVVVVLCAAALFGFWLWSPLSYGTEHLEEETIIWTQDWRFGDKVHRALARSHH